MAYSGVKWTTLGTIVLRMGIVISFLVIMPVWALTGARHNESEDRIITLAGGSQDGDPGSARLLERKPLALPQAGNSVSTRGGAVNRELAPGTQVDDATERARRQDPVSRAQGAQMHAIELRLRNLGATWLRLERLNSTRPDDQQNGYFFACRIPLPNNPTYCKQFEARSKEPATAMQRVADNIQQWLDAQTLGRR